MDGLIKGLIDAALGRGDENKEESGPESRDEQSRSTWVEVSTNHIHNHHATDVLVELCADLLVFQFVGCVWTAGQF